MSKSFSTAQLFLMGGTALALLGLILWSMLRIPSALPPYLVTALLALGYGLFCWKQGRQPGVGKS